MLLLNEAVSPPAPADVFVHPAPVVVHPGGEEEEAPVEAEKEMMTDFRMIQGVDERIHAASGFCEHGRHHCTQRLHLKRKRPTLRKSRVN